MTLAWAILLASGQAEQIPPISIAKIKRSKTVDFSREILPILRKSCLPCHNANDAKGEAILETPDSIAKGGETGPSAVPRKPKESLLLRLAAHEEKPYMPPKNNKADAHPLTPDELGLISLWIKQGAKGAVESIPVPLVWQNLPDSLQAINALAMTKDGFEVAVAHGNQISLYQLPTGIEQGALIDPSLANPKSGMPLIQGADRDVVESLAYSPDGHWLASGGYRTIRLWERQPEVHQTLFPKVPNVAGWSLPSANGKALLTATAKGGPLNWWISATNTPSVLPNNSAHWIQAAFSPGALEIALLKGDGKIEVWQRGQIEPDRQIITTNQSTEIVWLGSSKKLAAIGRGIMVWEPGSTNAPRLIQGDQTWKLGVADLHGLGVAAVSPDNLICVWDLKGEKIREIKSTEPVRALALDITAERLAVVSEGRFRIHNIKTSAVTAEPTHDARLEIELGRNQRLLVLAKSSVELKKQAKENAGKQVKAETEALKKTKELLAATDKTLTEKTKPLEERIKTRDATKEELSKSTDEPKKKDLENKLKDAEKELKEAIDARDQAVKAQQIASQNLELTQTVLAKAEQDLKNSEAALALSEETVKNREETTKLLEAQVVGTELNPISIVIQIDTKKVLVGQSNGVVLSYDLGKGFASQRWQLATNGWDANSLLSMESAAIGWRDEQHRWRSLELNPKWKLVRTIGADRGESPLADRVVALAFSPDSQTLASGGGIPSRSGEIKIWSTKEGRLVQTMLNQHSDTVAALAFSPDGKQLASGGTDKMGRIHDVATGRMIRVLEGHTGHVLAASWRDDGKTLVTAGADKLAKVWDIESGEQKKTISGFSKEITSLTHVSGSSEFWETSGETVKMRREDGSEVHGIRAEGDYFQAGAISSDGAVVAAGGIDGILYIYNGQTMGLLGKVSVGTRPSKP